MSRGRDRARSLSSFIRLPPILLLILCRHPLPPSLSLSLIPLWLQPLLRQLSQANGRGGGTEDEDPEAREGDGEHKHGILGDVDVNAEYLMGCQKQSL